MKNNRVFVFIDASNLWNAQKTRGQMIDFAQLKSHLAQKFNAKNSLKIYYYTAYPAEGTRGYSTAPKHRFFRFLEKDLGFIVRKKPLKQIHNTANGTNEVYEKGNMDVEMTIDVVNQVNNYDTVIFFSGDSDFLALVSFARRRGKLAYVVSSKNNVSKEMRTGSNGYFDILDFPETIWRDNKLAYRNQRAK
jgi:uncharacterized LabA/DUF88 family protein